MEKTILLPKLMNINVVGELLKEIRSIILDASCIVLDAKEVEEIDALGLQIILAIEKTAAMNGIEMKKINVQEKLKNVLNIN